MIRTISLLFLASTLFFSSNIKAFDQDLLNKSAELLKLKQKSRELKERLDPPVKYEQKKEKYAQKNAITPHQYLKDNYEKLLAQYREFRLKTKAWLAMGLSSVVAGFITKFIWNSLYGDELPLDYLDIFSSEGLVPNLAILVGVGVVGYWGFQIKNNPTAVTEQQKKEARLKILETKIQKVKRQNKLYELAIVEEKIKEKIKRYVLKGQYRIHDS